MERFQIKRFVTGPHGTFGVFLIDETPICLVLEETWDPAKAKVSGSDSAIMPGKYKVGPHSGAKYKNVFILKDVPGRSAILIHNGNYESNTAGCILVGKTFISEKGKRGIGDSVATLDHLRAILPKSFTLEIVNLF